MKKIFLSAVLISPAIIISAQTPAKKITAKPVAATPVLKTLIDSASYVLGVSFTNFYKDQGISIPKLNTAMVSKAITDVLAGKPSLIDNATANMVMNKCLTQIEEEKAKPNIEAGQKFLAKNKLRPEVKTTASGLQYEIVIKGTGEKPTTADSVTCNYMGTFINGVEFDNSYRRGSPITFAVTGVIRGWTEGLQLMVENEKRRFWIPVQLAYKNEAGKPAGMLVFDVELLRIQ